MIIHLPDEASSIVFANRVAAIVRAPVIMTFSGNIGAGKTTFIRAMLRALGITGPIKSPTYTLIESYQCNSFTIHHFDLYRIIDEVELDYLGFRDYFTDDAVCCIEWPERACQSIRDADIRLTFEIQDAGRRLFLNAKTLKGETMLTDLMSEK